jgi:hypothetical protein
VNTREAVEIILRRWGNEASRHDQATGRAIAGDTDPLAHARAVAVLVALVDGTPPRPDDGRSWWTDTNHEDAER